MCIYQPSNRSSSPPPKLSVLFMNQTWVLLVMKARLGRLFFFMARVCPAVQRFYGYNCEDKKSPAVISFWLVSKIMNFPGFKWGLVR